VKPSSFRPATNVLGIDVDAIDMDRALGQVSVLLQSGRKGYVCVVGVHGVMEAQRSEELFEVYAGSEMTIPDGMPLVWVGHMQGHTSMQRVTGPDLMLEVFRRKEFAHVTHYFYGGRPGVADELRDRMKEQFPWARILGTFTPPFGELSAAEEEQFAAVIRELKPDIVWVGIGCPRQEMFMGRHLAGLDTKLMFGVGAAFDYHTGRIRDCAEWIKRAGLQWLHRLWQDPRRLWWRYLRTNPAFLWHITWQLCGLRQYPTGQRADAPQAQHFSKPELASQERSSMARTARKQDPKMGGYASEP
jgi:N-acetylglucosaminyldiphosphoundecaprenol N-acetyl-beta-D-mannosaminyltransferase